MEYNSEKVFKIFKIDMNFKTNIFERGIDPLKLLFELADKGDVVEANTNISRLPSLTDINPNNFYLSWNIILKTKISKDELLSIFTTAINENEIVIEEYDEDYLYYIKEQMMENKIGEVLLEKGLITAEELNKALEAQKRLGEILIGAGKVMPNKVVSIIQQQHQIRKFKEMNTIKIDTYKLDNLIGLIDMLEAVQSEVRALALGEREMDFNYLKEKANTMEELTKDIQKQIKDLKIMTDA